jgi:hypothetical protein
MTQPRLFTDRKSLACSVESICRAELRVEEADVVMRTHTILTLDAPGCVQVPGHPPGVVDVHADSRCV